MPHPHNQPPPPTPHITASQSTSQKKSTPKSDSLLFTRGTAATKTSQATDKPLQREAIKKAAKRKLLFEQKQTAPLIATSTLAMKPIDNQRKQAEEENLSVEATNKTIAATKTTKRTILHFRKEKKQQNTILKHQKQQNNKALQKTVQKRKIKKDYATAYRKAQKANHQAKITGSAISKATKIITTLIKRNPKAIAILITLIIVLCTALSLFSLFTNIANSTMSTIITATYNAENEDIDNAEIAYTEWETDLRLQIQNTEQTYPGYDEYRYSIDPIGHNPHELMAYLTTLYQNFTIAQIQQDLRNLYDERYTLTHIRTVERRSYTNAEGETVYYNWYILTTTLTSRPFTQTAVPRLNDDQKARYDLLMLTKGARAITESPFNTNWLPYVSSYYGYRIHPLTGQKDLHRGVDIALPQGTPIKAAHQGTVTFAGYDSGYGYIITIRNEEGIETRYAHCHTIEVSTNQTVQAGETIATVGSTGNSTGPHLHFEVLKDGKYLNPIYFADTGSFNL